MKKSNVFFILLLSVLFGFELVAQEAEESRPCSGEAYVSNETMIRALGIGESRILDIAKLKAKTAAKEKLARQINETVSVFHDANGTIIKSNTKAFIPSGATVICQKAIESDQGFKVYYVLEMSLLNYYTGLNELSDEQLLDYGFTRDQINANIEKYKQLGKEN